MTNEELIEKLRGRQAELSPAEMAFYLGELLGEPASQGHIMMSFKQAFPAIPLRVLYHAVAVGPTDPEFDKTLSPYWPNER